MIEEAPICIAMFDREMRYLAASRRWLASFSLGERDVIGGLLYEIGPAIPERWKEVHKRALGGQTLKEDEDLFQRPDGRTQWLSWEVRPWHRSDGGIGGIIIFINDVTARVEAERAMRASNEKLASETKALARLDEASSRLWQTQDLREGLAEMLTATIELMGADKGTVQLWDAERKILLIAAQRGFEQDFLESFREVSAADNSACGRALRTGKTVVIDDVEQDESFMPFRPIARAAGFRAVVSAPMVSPSGAPVGVLSAHFRSPHRPSDTDLRRLDLYRRRAAGFIERCRSGQALRDSEERLRLALEASRMGMWDRDMRAEKTTWNEEYHSLLGYRVGEIEPGYAAWMQRVHPDDRAMTEAKVASAMREHKTYLNEYRVLRPDGTVRWCIARGEFFYDDAGKPIRMIGLVGDVTEARHQAEKQRVLVAELQHRTRNLMAVVQSIAQQTMARADSLEDFESRFARRLAALSRVQSLLSRADSEPITIGALVAMELEALGPGELGGKVMLAGPKTRLRNRAVQMFSLAIHELATNALKYGALANEGGSLSVVWRIEGAEPDRRLLLEWIECGIATAPPAADAARRGYGRMLIEQALPYTLSARTTFELGADALRCRISLPVTTRDGREVAG
jgi:PAS domain S-box-containing protein